MYYYWAYGLTIQSSVLFPELFPMEETGTTDVELVIGDVQDTIAGDTGFRSSHLMISSSEYLLHVKDIASYYVQEGSKLIIQPTEGADWESIRLFCLSNAFAALLHQRNQIPLHCSAFIDQGELVLIMGESGAGKSTTLAAMINKGFIPFSDDVCVPVISEANDELYLYSSYPMMKYWIDTYDKVDIGGGIKDRKIRPDQEKYGVYFHDRFSRTPMKVKRVVLIEKDTSATEVTTRTIQGIELFQRLERNAYRGEYIGFSGLQKEHFTVFSRIANTAKTMLISRPTDENSIATVAEMILHNL